MSDQDFFFDDDEKVEAPKKGNKGKGSAPAKKAPAKKPAKPVASAPVTATMVTVPVTALIAVVTLLVGVIVGFVIAPKTPATSTVTPTQQESSSMGSGTAPELSDEQVQQGMPAGHPDVSGMGSGEATATK